MQFPFRPVRTAVLLAAAGLALAGCTDSSPYSAPTPESPAPSASSPDASSPDASPSPSTATGSAATTSLTVELMADGEAVTDTWTLQCEGTTPVGQSGAPDPEAACVALAEGGPGLMAESGANVSCTMQWGGPQRATVTGTVEGETVDAEFALTDGCQISRWEALAALLGPATAAQ
ncbi:serine protease inhibitor [Arthrobacter caoxuetaonis]|uniref:Serine protease inhibitor n=1 Tax=Arthrobacter caoxuetaonis TaxID=2886935 RepID=A0A9X1MFB5_9MICC|nr:serine protease inhibitor [Arthrobacter caoxuetaonis]MCC3281570.1 serine protease inhibitor [Arthrobacter caoxuetaonis]MCC3298761.1 serine protease inhibitor [Arthrobacter caoxuetaonis]USQ57492.1 serine protease inhibitor [Arthrobacter caoxuetaonis]